MGGMAVGGQQQQLGGQHPHSSTEFIQNPEGLGRTQKMGTPGQLAAQQQQQAPRGRMPQREDNTRPGYDPLAEPGSATIVDVPLFPEQDLTRTVPLRPMPSAPAGSMAGKASGTLMGVARPGIAPLNPGVPKRQVDATTIDEAPPSYRPLEELGATQNVPRLGKGLGPAARGPNAPGAPKAELQNTHPLGKRRFDKRVELRKQQQIPRAQQARSSNRKAVLILGAAVVLVVGAVVAVLVWPSAPPLKAQVRAADGGVEVLDITCNSCPEGTKLKVGDSEASVSRWRATLPLDAPLPVGDSTLKVSIDRPGSGRDETVSLPVRVAYRIRPDLTTLEGDNPHLLIVVEAMENAKVELEGEPISLHGNSATKRIEVIKDISGPNADGGAQLTRKISFVVTPPDGPEEKGSVAVSLAILPLVIEAPGRGIITEKQTFLLSGRTSPGAQLVVASREIPVAKDGTFSQSMNVSSVGSTTIEVRTKMPGRAPRLVSVIVDRVTNLEQEGVEAFKKRGEPMSLASVYGGIEAAIGKPLIVSGEVLEARVSDPRATEGINTMILRSDDPACGDRCLVRLVQGRADLGVRRGVKLRAYGVVMGAAAHDGGSSIPDVDVAFVLVDRSGDSSPPPQDPNKKDAPTAPASTSARPSPPAPRMTPPTP